MLSFDLQGQCRFLLFPVIQTLAEVSHHFLLRNSPLWPQTAQDFYYHSLSLPQSDSTYVYIQERQWLFNAKSVKRPVIFIMNLALMRIYNGCSICVCGLFNAGWMCCFGLALYPSDDFRSPVGELCAHILYLQYSKVTLHLMSCMCVHVFEQWVRSLHTVWAKTAFNHFMLQTQRPSVDKQPYNVWVINETKKTPGRSQSQRLLLTTLSLNQQCKQ